MLRTQNRAIRPLDESNDDLREWNEGASCGRDSHRMINGILYFKGERISGGPACPQFAVCNPARLPPRSEERDDEWDCIENLDESIRRDQCRDAETATLLARGKTVDLEYAWGDYDACGGDPLPPVPMQRHVQCAPKVNMELKPGMIRFNNNKPKGPAEFLTLEGNCNIRKEEPVPHIDYKCTDAKGKFYYGKPHPDQPRIDREVQVLAGCNRPEPPCPMAPPPSCGNDQPSFDW